MTFLEEQRKGDQNDKQGDQKYNQIVVSLQRKLAKNDA